MKKMFYVLATLWGVLGLQTVTVHFLGGSRVSFDVVLIAVLFYGLTRGPAAAQLMGFVWGLLVDASVLGVVGLHSLLYALCGFSAGMLRRQLDESKPWTQSLFTFGITAVYALLYGFLMRVLSPESGVLSAALLTLPILGAALAPVIFWLMHQWNRMWNVTERVDR